jgi:hypothetical protein
VTRQRRFLAASLPSVPTSGFYSHVVGTNMRRSRDIVLIRMHGAFNTSGQVTLAAPEMSGKSNEAIFHDLVLRRPPPGTFNLVIYTDPLDSMLDSGTIQITWVSLLLVKVWRQTLVAHWNQLVFILNTFAHVLYIMFLQLSHYRYCSFTYLTVLKISFMELMTRHVG